MHNEKDNNSKGTANTTTKLSPIAIVLIVIAVIALFSVIIAGAVSWDDIDREEFETTE